MNDRQNYPKGIPNPEVHGWFSGVNCKPDDNAMEKDIAEVAKLLNRSVHFVNDEGYENEVTAASVGKLNHIAWVEALSKEPPEQSGFWDVSFYLKGQIDNHLAIDWEIETYNPYFGCHVEYLSWWGEQLVLIYEEKHHTILAVIDKTEAPKLRNIEREWFIRDYHLFYKRREPGPIEVIEIPSLVRKFPIPESQLKGPVIVDEIHDRNDFLEKLKSTIFDSSPQHAETDFLLGSYLYPFWNSWPLMGNNYDNVYDNRRWNETRWLPFYWFIEQSEEAQESFTQLLEHILSAKVSKNDLHIYYAHQYLKDEVEELLFACQSGHLPKDQTCYFWIEWSVEAFHKYLHLFPDGFVNIFNTLKKSKKRWQKLSGNVY